jgi:tetratricopeptide (TPR) repeat protein
MSVIGDLEKELDKLEKDLANPALILGVGKLLYQLKDFQSALNYFARANELDWGNAEVSERMGDCCFLLGDYKQALTMYESFYQQETETDSKPFGPWSLKMLIRDQMMEQMVWQFFKNYGINTVESLHILVLSTNNGKWKRKFLNWGASFDLIKEVEPMNGELSFDHQVFDLIVWETNSEKYDKKEMERILMELNQFVKQFGLILHLHQGDPVFSHANQKECSCTVEEMTHWLEQSLAALKKENRMDVLPFSVNCFPKQQIST